MLIHDPPHGAQRPAAMPARLPRLMAALVLFMSASGCVIRSSGHAVHRPALPDGSGDGDAEPDGHDGLTAHTVKPSAIDPAISTNDALEYAYAPRRGSPVQKLLVFLPGTNGEPKKTTLFLKEAARAGYHAVGVAYQDDEAALQICKDDLDCYTGFRDELVNGVDASPLVQVRPPDSVHGRLLKLISHLEVKHPREGWGAFLTGGELAYPRIVFAGLSQGGGHAAFIARQHEVAGVIMFSSVCDTNRAKPRVPATWVTEPHATPSERYYGFDHTQEVFAPSVKVTWAALGLNKFGPRTSVDGASPPYGHSHQLTTDVPFDDRKQAHTLVVANGSTPKVDGVPLFRDVWRYMLDALASPRHTGSD